MRTLFVVWSLLIFAHPVAFAQTSSITIPGVSEPPEMTGEPKKITKPTDAQRQFGEIIGQLKGEEQAKAVREQLTEFIERNPRYSDAYLLRVICDLCMLNSRDYVSIANDLKKAISEHSTDSESTYRNLSDHYAQLGKVNVITGQHRDAIDDLEKAMKQDLSSAANIFGSQGVEPERASKPCIWNLTDLDALVAKFPHDYRAWLLRGLYFTFFTTFKEDFYANARGEFQKAAAVNPKSPLPHYFIGRLYSKASFWTTAAASSDAVRNEFYRKAIQEYSEAIQIDPGFAPAFEMRASAYEDLKEYEHAIKDYGRVLELDPDNVIAYADRGLAKLETGRYLGAVVDFGDAIRRKGDQDTSVGMSYEYRADAYMKLGEYRSAIADYSKAIERQLANQTFLLSLKQIRGLYPEYDQVSDETLCKKINALFWPEFDYSVIAKKLLEENGSWQISLINDLYEKRGDAYLQANDFRKGVLDFNRIFHGIPNFADTVDRWRMLGTGANGEKFYLDVKSVELPDNGAARLWLRTVSKKGSYTVQSYDLECKTKRISQTSIVAYDAGGKILTSSESGGGWERIVPDTMGERFYDGLCRSN
jgi:tetratricopeptide (TPR) repeat protein